MSEKIIKVSYTDKDVTEAAKRDKWRAGYYAMLATEIKRDTSEKGHLMFVTGYRHLKDPDDAGSVFGFKTNYWQCLPFRNEEHEGHVPLKFFATTTNEWLAAHCSDKVIAPPKKTDAGLLFEGEIIENSDYEAAKKKALDTMYERADAMQNDESNEELQAIVGTRVFAELYYGKDKETGQISEFPSLTGFCAELPADVELVDPSVAMKPEDDEGGDAEEEVERVVKPAAKKIASKVTSIKKAANAKRR